MPIAQSAQHRRHRLAHFEVRLKRAREESVSLAEQLEHAQPFAHRLALPLEPRAPEAQHERARGCEGTVLGTHRIETITMERHVAALGQLNEDDVVGRILVEGFARIVAHGIAAYVEVLILPILVHERRHERLGQHAVQEPVWNEGLHAERQVRLHRGIPRDDARGCGRRPSVRVARTVPLPLGPRVLPRPGGRLHLAVAVARVRRVLEHAVEARAHLLDAIDVDHLPHAIDEDLAPHAGRVGHLAHKVGARRVQRQRRVLQEDLERRRLRTVHVPQPHGLEDGR